MNWMCKYNMDRVIFVQYVIKIKLSYFRYELLKCFDNTEYIIYLEKIG